MIVRPTILIVMLALVGAACSSTTRPNPTSTLPETTTTSAPTTTATTTTTGAISSTSTVAAVGATETGNDGQWDLIAGVALGIGDDFYPNLGNPGYDVAHYTLDLGFDPDTKRLTGTAVIDATATTALDTFNLDFARLSVREVTLNGADACFLEHQQELIIAPDEPIRAGTTFQVQIAYEGLPGPAPSDAVPFGIGWFNSATNQSYVVAEPDAAHTWFPSNDHPLDKATFTFRITVPAGTFAAANGRLVDTVDDGGKTTYVWEMDHPMATYLATVVIGDFVLLVDRDATEEAGVTIRHVLPGTTTVADWPGLERQGEMLAFFSEVFGPYPFDEYGIAIVDGFDAALENQTLSLFDSDLARSGFFEEVFVHELAHQWFGDSVSPARWQDIWLAEGFASYAEWLWLEREAGSAALETGISGERTQFSGLGLPPPGTPPPDDLFNASVYRVGAMTLHALRLTIGDDAFFTTLRTYTARFRDGNATTTDFVNVAEEIAGMDLDRLFDTWLYEESIPDFPGP